MLETADEGLKYKEILSNASLELMKETIQVHTDRLSKVRHEAERIIDEIRAKAGEEHSNVLIERSKGWKEKARRVVQEKKHRKMQSLKMSRSAVSEPTNDANVCGARHDCEAFNELSARLQDIVTTTNDYDIQLDKGLLTTDNMKNNEINQSEFHKLNEAMTFTDVKADGNCFYQCISKKVHGNEDTHSKIRQNTATFMTKNQEHLKDFTTQPIETVLRNVTLCDGSANS